MASTSEEALPGGVSEFAWHWWTKRYLNRTSISAGRVEAVRAHLENHVIPFFSPRVSHISQITYRHVEEFLELKSGVTSHRDLVETSLEEARHYTLKEAGEAFGKSKSTMTKANLTGRFPNTIRDARGWVLIPSDDLFKAGYAKVGAEEEIPFGYAESTTKELLRTLRSMFRLLAVSCG